MTQQELKMILKLIDLYTVEEEYSYQCYNKRISDISGLKKDIKDIFGKSKKEKKNNENI